MELILIGTSVARFCLLSRSNLVQVLGNKPGPAGPGSKIIKTEIIAV
jgi:hypothetical protein